EVAIMYQLTFSNQADLQPHLYQEHVHSIYSIRSSTGDIIACIRGERDLIGYKYDESTGKWQEYWSERVFNKRGDYSAALYPWLVADKLLPNTDIIVLKHPDGIRFYEIDSTKPGLKLLKEDGHFHDVYGYTLLLGSFYSNKDYMGLMTRDTNRIVKFYAATSDSFLPNISYPLFPFDNKLSLTSAWRANDTDFFVTKLHHNNIEVIGIRTAKRLEFYQFNADYLLENIINTEQIRKSHNSIQDRIFFADLTHQTYQDILHLNDSGLFIYKYDHNKQDYKFLHHNTEFTQSRGWLSNYSGSISLLDINSDNRHDLLFTGPQGITALSFDYVSNNWKTLLSSEQLPGLQRYATIIGSLPAMPPAVLQPSIFIQDTEGKVQWAKIVHAQYVTTSIMAPTSTTHETPIIQFPSQRRNSEDILVPDQIARTSLSEKPILHWAEQWSDSFLKEAVDIASGQVRLNIPLIDILSLTGWGVQLTLSYDSQVSTSDLLGVGWSLPLAQDYIFVDYQGSVIPDDARYYLMIQGRPQLLKLTTNKRRVQRFLLAEADNGASAVTIEYHMSEQYWLIEGTAEQTIYGKASNIIAKDALWWSLGWSNWRGPGRDRAQQQPLITAWYLNNRFDKNNQKALYYYYEIDISNINCGKAYSSALRLKTISDNQEMQLTLDYSPKSRSEYTVPNPIDDKGNIIFPIPNAQSHYMQGYSITTSAYSQVLKFSYHINNGKRLLTAIAQQLLSHSTPMLQFSYQHLLEKQVLTSCKLLPRGSTVNFKYDSITPAVPSIAHDNILSYPIGEKVKIAYGPDYTVMAYPYFNPVAGKVIVRIMNREMTQTVTDCAVYVRFLNPSARSAIKDYTVHAYSNSFVVFVESDQKEGLYIFNRHNKQTWSTVPTVYSFSNKVLVRFGETVIAAAEPNQNKIVLFERGDDQSGWNEKTLSIPRAMTFLALHKRLVVGYDDNQLWLLHHDGQYGWQRKALGSNLPGLSAMNRNTLGSFDLTSEILQQISTALEQNGLQIFTNFVLLSALQENNGQLFSHIHLFLLDAQHNVITKQYFKIKRENLYKITRESKSQDQKVIYNLGYIQEGGIFKVRVKSISGKFFEYISNRNRRQDAIDQQKSHLNQDQEFQKSAKEYFFLDWNLYPVQISQYGAYCGNDILLRTTGTGWEKESLSHTAQRIRLGQNFILEANDNKSLLKLYKQDNNKNKFGKPIKELQLHSPDQLINRYPAYIAYHSELNLVKVLIFHDDKTLGQIHTFSNEQLLQESDWQNLVTIANSSSSTTVHAELQECKVRPISTLTNPKPQLFVGQMMIADGNIQRLTGYQHSFNNSRQELTYSEKVTIIPGDNKNLYGWYEVTRSRHVSSGNITKTEHWFNANGQEVLMPPKEQSDKQDINTANDDSESNKGLLLDRSGKWLISDISPYKLADEMIAYYGVESYENNHIGSSDSNGVTKIWNLNKAKIIKGKFAFTGENYLQLSRSVTESQSFLEGVLQPRDQETTYLAACWIRCSTLLELNKPAQYLRAIISTIDGTKVIPLLAETKHQIGDWFYLELPINFQVVKQIYKDYVDYNATSNTTTILPSPSNAQFKITLRVEAPYDQTVDLDHIRFSPLTHDFQAIVYHPLTGKSTALIQANGLVYRNIHNRLEQEIANVDEEGQLKQFSSSSKTGKLVPLPQGSIIDAKPNTLTFEPENGFYETFDSYALRHRWQLDNPHAWNIAPSQLWHKQSGRHQIKASNHLFNSTSAAIRCYFALQQSQSSLSFNWQGIGKLEFMRQSDDLASLVLPNGYTIAPLQSAGELIVMLEEHYIWLWLDGVLLLDQELSPSRINSNEFTSWSSFSMQVQNQVLLEDMLVMNRPQVKVQYYNAFGEKTQAIQLENAETSLVTETLYDELGREAITTKTTRVDRTADQPLLAYHQDFVTNKDYSNVQSVWLTGKLQGKIDQLNTADQGVAYTRTEYTPNPLNEAAVLGLPSPEFSITGRYITKMSRYSDIAFLDNLFPISHGYRQKVKHTSNGCRKVTIFDKRNNQVALYVQVPSYNHLLSTYEYDTENRLVKILPPLYHEKVDTALKLTMWQPGEDHLSIQEKQWQQALATYFMYDKYGHLIRKITPDSGLTEYLYNTAGQVRFMVSVGSTNQPQIIIYFNYDINGQLSSTGYFNQLLPIDILQIYLEIQNIPNVREYQQFDYADDQLNPLLRGRVKYCITQNQGEPIIDKLTFNAQQQIISKSTITLSGEADGDQLIELTKQYVNNKINILTYPITVDGKPLSIVHSYNRLGQLVALGTNEQPNYYASFSYHAIGQLASEHYEASTQHGFIRRYRYNSPGFLNQIADPFLTEEITYTENGYGHAGYGDGLIMQTAFNASWPVNADGKWFQLQEAELVSNYSAICMNALKRTGYVTAHNKPVKLYIRDIETTLPLVCGGETGRNIAKLIAEKLIPNYYGHRYAYGNHQELVKAKYFTDDSQAFVAPLQSDSFVKRIPNLTNKQSQHIWQLLVNTGYIITDQQRTDSANTIGKRGKSFLRSTELRNDLLALSSGYILFAQAIERLVVAAISKQQEISLTDFETVFLHWQAIDQSSFILVRNQEKAIAKQIGQMLLDKGYLPTRTTGFTATLGKNFTDTLHQYVTFIPQIVQVLSQHFAYSLGEATFDVESYNIDANGNHHLFYTGFNRYELAYRNTTNQIKNIKLNWPAGPTELQAEQTFAMQHDDQGNVIQALHKDIQSIKYHPVSQRSTHIQLTDGRTLRFYYDAQGERILKRVFNAEGKINQETHYLRDEQGRVLVDRQTKYLPQTTQEIVTAYLYGPRGLLGFFRNNSFYGVTTDHAGSVRLVLKDGKVVAAYDYLPYGQLMRSYGNDPQAHIMYRYTGQEWDEETGLYNYHARLYDPSIGRFYQPDPKAQYFSPYKYAGNSPISTIDPDGEFAFLIAGIIFAVAGAYLGGAASNNRWNPVDWDFKDPGTWLGIGGGALAGGLLPIGFGASVATIGSIAGSTAIGVGATIGLGAGGAYLSTAAANQNWNPVQWNWDRPNTWSGLFQGFGAGSGIAGGIGLAHNFANTGKALTVFSKALGVSRDLTKVMFLGVSYTAGGGLAYGAGVSANNGNFAFWQWDWEGPTTWSALVDGFDTGMGWPQNFIDISRGISKLSKRSPKSHSLLGNPSKIHRLKIILKNPKHPLYKVTTSIVMAYFMGSSANGELDITRWSLASFSTYEGVLNGIFFGKDTSNMLKQARTGKMKQWSNSLAPTYKNKLKHWAGKFGHMLDYIQDFRIKIESKRVTELLFSSDKRRQDKLQQLRNVPDAPILDIENFFKSGLEKWKKSNIEPPDVLKHLISQEAEQKVLSSTQTQKLIEWRTEEGELSRKQQEVFSDRDAEFLNCHSIARRRKRGADTLSCVPSISAAAAAIPETHSNKPKDEIIVQFFDSTDPGILRGTPENNGYVSIQPSNINQPEGFAEHFSLILQQTPTLLGPSKPQFWPNFILGSLYTVPAELFNVKKDVYAKIETVKFHPYTGKRGNTEHKILKTVFKKDDQTLVLKTFIAEEHRFTSKQAMNVKQSIHEYYKQKLDLNSKYSKDELDKISTKLLGINDNYKIEENVFYIDVDNSLSVKALSSTKEDYQYKDTSSEEFQKIEYTNIDIEHLEGLSNDNINNVKSSIEAISLKLLKMYNSFKIVEMSKKGESEFKKGNQFGSEIESEAAFQGFFYGVFASNFKYRYYLDIYVERTAGKGYADLMILSRKGNGDNKNWRAIPIVIEFKADATSSDRAIDQIKSTGYLYNLSMRTIADQAVIVGINSKIDSAHVAQVLNVKIENIPQPEGLINPLIKNINDHKKTEYIENTIKEELKHLYYSISPLAIKTNDHYYLSRLILGEFLSGGGAEKVHVYNAKNTVSTFVFQEKRSQRWIMLNVVESSKDKIFQDVNLDEIEIPYNVHINRLTKIDIKVNHNSKMGWSPEEKLKTDEETKEKQKKLYFFQNVEVFEHQDVSNFRQTNNYKKLTSISIQNFFSRGNIDTELKQLSQSLMSIRGMVNSESDFQAILHGMFFGKYDKFNTIKVLPEVNTSKSGRIDLVISKIVQMSGNEPKSGDVIIMELKYAKYISDAENKLNEANEQIYKYLPNLKSITDLKKVTPITLVFNKNANIGEDVMLYKIHNDATISHTSDDESDLISMRSSDSDITPFSKKSRIDNLIKRSINYTKGYESISVVNISNRSVFGEDDSYITLNQEKGTNTKNSHFNVVSSGASSRLQFWPINFVKNIGIIISSILPNSWISDMTNHNAKSLPPESLPLSQTDLPVKQLPLHKNQEAGSTLLEMGDQWLNNTDINGLLTFGILLVRKWTGYKPQSSELLSDNQANSIELDIQSATLVDVFQNVVLKHAQICGIRSCMSDIFEDSELYSKTIQVVRKELAIGKLAAISQLMYQQLVHNNIKKVASKSTQAQANKLLARLADDIPNLQQQFLDYEQEWLSNRKLAMKTMASQVYCNNIKGANVGILSQAISSMQQSEQLAQQYPARALLELKQ
ncbi:hypothetical protein HUJ05_006735, partial [Dendroctonus ponderosae]